MANIGYIVNWSENIPDEYWVSPYFMRDGKFDKPMQFDPKEYKDEAYDHPPNQDKYIWLVDTYTTDGYEGSGERLGIRKSDKKLVFGYTSHCSCNGPWETEDYNPDETVTRVIEVLAEEAERINWGKELEMNVKLFEDIINKEVSEKKQ